MNKFGIAALLFVCTGSLFAQSASNVIDEVIWVVGDEAIYKSDVEEARIAAKEDGEVINGDPYCVIPEQLAVQKLFLHQAEIDSIEVSDTEVFSSVDRYVEAMIEQQYGSREKMEQRLGKSYAQIRETLYDRLKNNEIVRQVQSKLVEGIKVTPAQVRNYFKSVPEDSLPFVPTTVEVQIITREPKLKQEEIDAIKADLRSYTDLINSGQMQFSTLAVMYSEDRGSSIRGGELGFMGRAQLVPEFANVAFNLTDTKTVSKIVESEFGFHIIQLIEKRGDKANFRHILRKPRASDEAFEDCVSLLDSISDDIRRGKSSFEDCVARYSFDKDTRNNYGNMVYTDMQTYESGTRIEMVNLPPEVARAVAGLNIGEISKPFVMIDSRQKEVVAIVKLKNRNNGHRATMKEDYQVLQNLMVERLSDEKINKWIREKQKTTYIRINEDWRNCEFQYPGWIKE